MKWNFSQGIRTGCGHVRQEQPCQDMIKASSVRQDNEKSVYAAALADGAGSAANSAAGARRTVDFICGWIKKHFDEVYAALEAGEKNKIANKLKKSLQGSLKKLAGRTGASGIGSLACTMMFAAVSGDRYIIGHIGDGIIAALTEKAQLEQPENSVAETHNETMLLSAPQNGKYINETFFVTQPEMDSLIKFRQGSISAENIRAFALMSDGISDAVWKRNEGTFVGSFSSLLKYAAANPLPAEKEIERLLEKVSEAATDDDCSLIIMSAEVTAYSKK